MLFLQFSLEQENLEIWIMALKGIFDLLLIYGLEYFNISQNVDSDNTNASKRVEKSRTVRLYTDSDQEISVSSMLQSGTDKNGCNFIKILAGLLDNAVRIIYIINVVMFVQIETIKCLFFLKTEPRIKNDRNRRNLQTFD